MKVLKLLTATVLALGVADAYADKTNLVQNVNIQLFGIKQGDTETNRNLVVTSVDVVRVDTRRVIRAIGEATGHDFSSASRLVLVSPMNGDAPSFEVRDGSSKVDVSSFFSYQQVSDSVHSSVLNLRNGRSADTHYSVQRLVLQNTDGYAPLSLNFDVNGVATQVGVSTQVGDDVGVEAMGAGNREGSLLILQGGIGVFGHQIEVIPEDPTGPILT